MDQSRADSITMFYGQGEQHHAARHLPYYANLMPSLVVHETHPKQTRPDALYVTNGLSAPMAESPTGYGFELQMIAPRGKAWPVTLLVSLAAHVVRTDSRFGMGQSIALTNTLTGLDDTLSALIFTKAPGLPHMLRLPEGDVSLITVVGVTEDEYSWARRYSAHELVALLQLCGQGVATLPGRRSVVPGVAVAAPQVIRTA
jgi:suppressor of fused protein SUFU